MVKCITNGKTYKSLVEAGKDLGISSINISQVCNRNRLHIKGYRFKWIKRKKMGKFSNARIRAGFKDWLENNYEEYEIAKAEAFREFFENETEGMEYDEMTIEWYEGLRDSFTFKDIDDWANDAYESYVGDAIDHAYDEMKDRRMGI